MGDWLMEPRDEVFARLERQAHRRFIKTHTPLDGLPIDSRATYLVVARHPLDAAAWPSCAGCRGRRRGPRGRSAAFFRRGDSGAGRELLTDDELERYQRRAGELAVPELLAWLHR